MIILLVLPESVACKPYDLLYVYNFDSNTLAYGPFPINVIAGILKTEGENLTTDVPLREIGRPGKVAGRCMFLSSKAGAFINGATITVDS